MSVWLIFRQLTALEIYGNTLLKFNYILTSVIKTLVNEVCYTKFPVWSSILWHKNLRLINVTETCSQDIRQFTIIAVWCHINFTQGGHIDNYVTLSIIDCCVAMKGQYTSRFLGLIQSLFYVTINNTVIRNKLTIIALVFLVISQTKMWTTFI